MPKTPKGNKRPSDVIGNAIRVAQIATGEVEETEVDDGKNKAAQELGRLGGKARSDKLTSEQKQEIARAAASARWRKSKDS